MKVTKFRFKHRHSLVIGMRNVEDLNQTIEGRSQSSQRLKKCDVLSWRQEDQRTEVTLRGKGEVVLRETVNDSWFSKSKTCSWWRNESLQMRNLTSWDRQSLICKRVRSSKVINNNHTWHAS